MRGRRKLSANEYAQNQLNGFTFGSRFGALRNWQIVWWIAFKLDRHRGDDLSRQNPARLTPQKLPKMKKKTSFNTINH